MSKSEEKIQVSLGDLIDPESFTTALKLGGKFNKKEAVEFYDSLYLIREVEEAIANLVIDGTAHCPCHLAIGQEAVAVGIAHSLNNKDRIFGAHRSHAHFLAVGGTPISLLAEILGKESGCSKGMGGSMHLLDHAKGFYGSVPIVAGAISIAAGAAMALKMSNSDNVAVAYFGDGATEEGVFHETINFCAKYELPLLFVCENNLYSSHLDISLRQPFDSVARFAKVQGIDSEVIDGNDVVRVAETASKLINAIRKNRKPAFIEAVTYRWRGHVGPNEDIDVGVRRKPGQLDSWKARDPIRRLHDALIAENYATAEELTERQQKIKNEVIQNVKEARDLPYPPISNLMRCVYSD